jgi:hypothetical protein
MCSQASISRRICGSYALCKYSTFKGITAGLIDFQTVFVFPVKDTRTKTAKIKVRFTQTIPSRRHPTKLPNVIHRFPQLQQSVATAFSVHGTSDANLAIQPPEPANVGSIAVGRSSENPHAHRHGSQQCRDALQ